MKNLKTLRSNVIVNLQQAGTHCWQGCNIEQVSYLRNSHRHVFHICCKKNVTDDDRQIEIICFKDKIQEYLIQRYGNPCSFGGMSCEMIARELQQEFDLSYCRVLEDGENGAEITDFSNM